MTKAWYLSKTLWVNAIALIAIIAQGATGFVIALEAQAGLLVIVNLILRAITNEGLTPTSE
jgi:hypothetical protein